MFNAPVKECVTLVVDPTHPRYGQLSEISILDWREGQMLMRFANGETATFDDGFNPDDFSFPQAFVLEKTDQSDLSRVQRRLELHRAYLELLMKLKGYNAPRGFLLQVKAEFWRVLREGEVPARDRNEPLELAQLTLSLGEGAL